MAQSVEARAKRPRVPSKGVKKKKGGTVTTQKHRFQPFSERVAKLNIDAVRSKQARSNIAEDDESHFLTALEDWKDRNLSESFTGFARRVEPFSQNLPQLIHYEDDVVSALQDTLRTGDSLALEALLDLVAKFAHDLGPRFEKHFGPTVQIISQLAATHSDVAVIEWSFTCLAWLFKYLARLLVPDLRPLFDLMSPLLGKESKKDFVTRFAAESMSYLVRKASVAYGKTVNPLDLIVQHAFYDLCTTSPDRREQYQQGLAVLFSDAIKGVRRGVGSGAAAIMRSLLSQINTCTVVADRGIIQTVVEATTIDVIHSTDSAGFSPVLEPLLDWLAESQQGAKSTAIAARMLYVVIGTRQGTRIDDWSPILSRLVTLFQASEQDIDVKDNTSNAYLMAASVLAMQYASFNLVLPFSQKMIRCFESEYWRPSFLTFCNMFADANSNRERFNTLVLPGLQTYIVRHWEDSQEQLCLLTSKDIGRVTQNKSSLRLPLPWQEDIDSMFKELAAGARAMDPTNPSSSDCRLMLLNSYVDDLKLCEIKSDVMAKVAKSILETVDYITLNQSGVTAQADAFVFGKALDLLHHIKPGAADALAMKSSDVFSASSRHMQRPGFLIVVRNLLAQPDLVETLSLMLDDPNTSQGLMTNLASPSHELRTLSLDVLLTLLRHESPERSTPLLLCREIESFEPSLHNLRAISLKIRKLGSTIASSSPASSTLEASIAYCFGLLHVRLTPMWSDVCKALIDMKGVVGAEDIILGRAISWLNTGASSADLPDTMMTPNCPPEPESFSHSIPGFQCANLSEADSIFSGSVSEISHAQDYLLSKLQHDIRELPKVAASNRMQALMVLKAMPELAEKRSRSLVPVLLHWAIGREIEVYAVEDGDDKLSEQSQRWSRSERNALLGLFSQCVNPGVLYRSKEVYEALLNLLCNGDVELQRAALKAIFTWKAPSTKLYETNLVNILDDARFREEITIFLDGEDATAIRLEHRAGLMPVLLRLLYGRVVTRTGLGGSRGSQEARRKAVFMSLAKLGPAAIEEFVTISLGPLADTGSPSESNVTDLTQLAPRRMLGIVRMLRDMFETLSNHLALQAERIATAIMTCLSEIFRRLSDTRQSSRLDQASLLKDIRQEGLVCLNLLFSTCPQPVWIGKIQLPLSEQFIKPRLPNLAIETAQSPSVLVKMFATWSSHFETRRLLWDVDAALLDVVADCVTVTSAKDELKIFVLTNIVGSLITAASDEVDGYVIQKLKEGSAFQICRRIIDLLRQDVSKEVLDASIRALIGLQPFITDKSAAAEVFEISLTLLTQPSRKLSPRIKGEILILLEHLLPLLDLTRSTPLFDQAIKTLSGLFSYFQDARNRDALVHVFTQITQGRPALSHVAAICGSLNAHSSSRLDEPDYELRGIAFTNISELAKVEQGPVPWMPILHNLLFFVRDNEEIATRSGAAIGLRQLIQQATATIKAREEFKAIIDNALIPDLQKGMKEQSEMVRAELVAVLAELVKNHWHSVDDMGALLGTDDETSFFNNILHIQPHRRIRALQRLSQEAAHISSVNLSKICLPLIENFLGDVDDGSQNLAHEAVSALESIAQNLEWHRFRALLQRMMQDSSTFTTKLKIRTLGAVVNGLYYASVEKVKTEAPSTEMTDSGIKLLRKLAATIPAAEALSKSITDSVLTKLLEQIHYQDDASMDIRILLALVAVRLILALPLKEIDSKLPTVLMDICNILKSRAQEARDSARKTLADVSALIGPKYFSFILKQLRTALKRGGQLHVLAYTVHSLVVSVTPKFEAGSLDYCLSDIVSVVIDSTFGHVGQEKEAQGYLNSMKEFKKKTVGFDTMELVATTTSLPHVSKMLKPLQSQLEGARPRIEKIDEMLRRIREGLRRNTLVKDHDFLTLCYELLNEAKQHKEEHGPSLRSSKMSAFAFELLRRVLDKHEELKTPQNLEGFMIMLDTALKVDDEEVQMSSMRFLSSIIKVHLTALDEQSGSYIRMGRRTIEAASSIHTPNAQAALRLVSAVLRERPAAVIKKSHFESDIAFLLGKIKPDLEEPASQGDRDRQVAAFNFLKAVMSRGIFMKEIYEVMDVVREVMITSSAPPIPDLARSVYSRFVLDFFPEEGKGLARQLEFLTSNLQYEHQRGRQSVMEVMMFLLNKRSSQAVQPILVTFFLPLLLVLIVDQTAECRESAALLLRKIFERADKERTKAFRAQLISWLTPETDPLWTNAAFKVWSMYLDVHTEAVEDAAAVELAARRVIRDAEDGDDTAPLALSNALESYHKLVTGFPTVTLSTETEETWIMISKQLECQDPEIQIRAAKLLSAYLADFNNNNTGNTAFPLYGSQGLELTISTMQDLIATHMSVLSSLRGTNQNLADTTIQNLTLISRLCTSTNAQDGPLLNEILTPLSETLRRENTSAAQPPYAKLASARLLQVLLQHLPIETLTPHLQNILLPLQYLTTAPIPTSAHPDFSRTFAHLTTLASELLQTFQEKLGPERYVREMGDVQRFTRERREGRGKKRALERVARPERAERERVKRRKGDVERRSRKSGVREGMRRGW